MSQDLLNLTTFDLWIRWCVTLQEARGALRDNVSSPNFWDYMRAVRYALRRCEGLERALTAN